MGEPHSTFASIVMPALNEERYISDAIASILPAPRTIDYEVLVMDGGSTDRTMAIVSELAAQNPKIHLVSNPRRVQSAAMNIAAKICDPRATVLIRADCHARYPKNFVNGLVNTLHRTGSSSVVVRMHAIGVTPVQSAFAAAQNSRLGNGGSRHRTAGESGFVDHGHHAAFHRETFLRLGGYDENAPFNEDAEFDARLGRSGGRIYLDAALPIEYLPRSSFLSLARQYRRHGRGRGNTILKHGMLPKLRQIAPVLVLVGCLMALTTWPLWGAVALLPTALYVIGALGWGALLALRAKSACLLLSGPAAIVMHMSWAVGLITLVTERQARVFAERLRMIGTSTRKKAT